MLQGLGYPYPWPVGPSSGWSSWIAEGPSPAGQPRFLDRVRAAIRTRPLSAATEHAYVGWIRRSILFHRKCHPAAMGAAEVTAFLTALAIKGRVSASTQHQALSALRFLYRSVLDLDRPWLDGLVRARRPVRLPAVLSRREVRTLLRQLEGVPWLTASLLHGSRLRLMECARVRGKDIDLAGKEVTVRDGKGQKDRRTVLPDHNDHGFPPMSSTAVSAVSAARSTSRGDRAHGYRITKRPLAAYLVRPRLGLAAPGADVAASYGHRRPSRLIALSGRVPARVTDNIGRSNGS